MTRRTDHFNQLDIRELPDEMFEPGASTSWSWWRSTGCHRGDTKGEKVATIGMRCETKHRMWLVYSVDGEDKKYPVSVEWTPCNFGGERPWWLCPGQGCGRRCAILYGGEVFVCRECRDLTYYRETISGQSVKILQHKIRKIERQYKDEDMPDCVDLLGDKPKHMHESTWAEIQDEYERLRDEYDRAFAMKARQLAERADGVDAV